MSSAQTWGPGSAPLSYFTSLASVSSLCKLRAIVERTSYSLVLGRPPLSSGACGFLGGVRMGTFMA